MAAPVKKSELSVLCHLNFPSYQIRALNEEVVIVSGGGGGAKTGVLNQIELFKVPIVSEFDKKKPRPPIGTTSLGSLDTGDNAVMSIDLVPMGGAALLCTAEGNRCVEYFVDCNNTATTAQSVLHPDVPTALGHLNDISDATSNSVRHRSHLSSISSEAGVETASTVTTQRSRTRKRSRRRSESFSCPMEPGLFSCTRLYLGGDEPIATGRSGNFGLNCVRYTPDGACLLLGSPKDDEMIAGRLRVLGRTGCIAGRQFPASGVGDYAGFEAILDIDASIPTRGVPTDVQSLCVSPDGSLLCSICDAPDNRVARLWYLQHRSQQTDQLFATLTHQGKVDYRVRHCSFGRIPGRPLRDGFLLYLTHMPINVRVTAPNYISVWLIRPSEVSQHISTSLSAHPLSSKENVSPATLHKTPASGSSILQSSSTLTAEGPVFPSPKQCVLHTLPSNHRPACIAISEDGRHLAVGTLEGRVEVFESKADGLKSVYVHADAHSTFVTDVTFLPLRRNQKSRIDWELLSISTDTRLRWHGVARMPHNRLNYVFVLSHLFLMFIIGAIVSLFD